MQGSYANRDEIERLLFELNRCANDLLNFRLSISTDDIHQTELSLHKLQALISSTVPSNRKAAI